MNEDRQRGGDVLIVLSRSLENVQILQSRAGISLFVVLQQSAIL